MSERAVFWYLRDLRSYRDIRERFLERSYPLLSCRFLGLEINAAVRPPTVFTHNRDRLLATDVARAFLTGLLALKPANRLLSSDHVSVDGMLVEGLELDEELPPEAGLGEPPRPGRNGARDFQEETAPIRPRGATARRTAGRVGCASQAMR